MPRPVPGPGDVLVRVHATTVNRTDCGFRDPRPFFVRAFSGLVRPKHRILGTEFAGVVAATGTAVTSFAVGDRVFGVNADHFGAHAEYVCVAASAPIATMPDGMTFADAAAICDGAVLARTCLTKSGVTAGTKLMIYGATGSIGTAALQLARHLGADVTAVCRGEHADLVRSLGADRVIDYELDDFTRAGDDFDVVLDAVGKRSFGECKRLLRVGGTYASTDLGPGWQNPPLTLVTRVDEASPDGSYTEVPAGARHLLQGAARGRRAAPGHRPLLPAGRRRRGDALRRDGAEGRQRRAHHRSVTPLSAGGRSGTRCRTGR